MFQRPDPTIDEAKSEAYIVYTEFGPNRRIPRPERMAACFPNLTAGERTELMAEFDVVDKAIWRYVASGDIERHPSSHFEQYMHERFPFMNNEALRRAWSLVVYYAAYS